MYNTANLKVGLAFASIDTMVKIAGSQSSIKELERLYCTPFIVPNISSSVKKTYLSNPACNDTELYLSPSFNLRTILSNPVWIDYDIANPENSLTNQENIATSKNRSDKKLSPSTLKDGSHFDGKYCNLLQEDDARHVCIDWISDVRRAMSHLNPRVIKGRLLHIGSDDHREPAIFHPTASSITLVDIAEQLLDRAAIASPCAIPIRTRAEELTGIEEDSHDFVVALRVFSSVHFNSSDAVQQITRVLRPSGSVLLSISNGYRAIDDTILSGQITDTPPKLNLSRPFRNAHRFLTLLYEVGFRELFMSVGSSEIYIGGTYLPYDVAQEKSSPIIHLDSIAHVPLCFYSSAMPTCWLGNYSEHAITIKDYTWPSVEHYFQASKFHDPALKNAVRKCRTPESAKRMAWMHQNSVRSDWRTSRDFIMYEGLQAKFDQHPELQPPLLATKGRQIIERSPTDLYWGRSLSGKGNNTMGVMLNELRCRYI